MKSFEEHLRGAKAHNREDKIWLVTCFSGKMAKLCAKYGFPDDEDKLEEWLESCQENQVSVLDEKIPLLSFAVDFVTAYEYQKSRGIKIHPGLWKDMRVDIFLVKKEN